MAETKKAQIAYDSNPFTLAFGALTNFFNKNAMWAIAIIVLGALGFIGQIGQNVIPADDFNEPDSSYSQSADDLPPLTKGLADPENTAALIAFIAGVLVVVTLIVIVASVIGTFVRGMFAYVALESEKQRSVSFSEAFNAVYKRFWRLLCAEILAGLKIFGWTLLFIIPGIIAALRYKLLSYVILSAPESEKGVINAHNATKVLVSKRLWEVFGVATVAGIIPVIGSLLDLSGAAALHNQLKAYNEAGAEKPKIHWLNYLGLILLAVFLFIVIGLALLFIAAFSFS